MNLKLKSNLPLMKFRSSKLKSNLPSFFDGGDFCKAFFRNMDGLLKNRYIKLLEKRIECNQFEMAKMRKKIASCGNAIEKKKRK